MVAHLLPKQVVAGSSPVSRSRYTIFNKELEQLVITLLQMF